jgi:hypothetical protein
MTYSIFGDSFATRYGSPKNPHYFNGETGDLWYDILKNETEEKLNIFAEGRLGPYTTFEDFYIQFENRKVTDKLIFFLSCQYRLPVDSYNQPICIDVLRGDKDTVLKPLEYEIFFIHKILKEEIFRANIKNIYFLKTLSQLKKIKIMVFLCFGFNRLGLHDYVNVKEIYELNNLNDEYFNIYTKPLFHVSLEESVNKQDYDDMKNHRANHFSFCNHRILTNKILNFFTGSESNEEWKKEFLTTWNDPSQGRDHFIYD